MICRTVKKLCLCARSGNTATVGLSSPSSQATYCQMEKETLNSVTVAEDLSNLEQRHFAAIVVLPGVELEKARWGVVSKDCPLAFSARRSWKVFRDPPDASNPNY